MASRASARRYARALFDVASKTGDPAATLAEMQAFASLVNGYPDLRKALLNVGLPLAVRTGILREVLALHPLSPIVARLLYLVLEHDDANELPMIMEDFERRVMDFHHVVRVEVTTAAPLDPGRSEALRAALAQVTGRDVRMDTRTDPSILGGVVAKVGSRVFDGSVTRHLERLRTRLAAEQAL
jgi:F-type H+-transporting ATPase subunit delta